MITQTLFKHKVTGELRTQILVEDMKYYKVVKV